MEKTGRAAKKCHNGTTAASGTNTALHDKMEKIAMPRPANPTPSISRTYKIPAELAEWLDREHTLYQMRDGRYANARIDVLRDALERIREAETGQRLGVSALIATAPHHKSEARRSPVPINFKLPQPLVEWLERYYRFHRMLDGTRAMDYTDLIIDALSRARVSMTPPATPPRKAGRS